MSPGEPPKSPRVIELSVDLPTDPDTLWRLLTDSAGLAQWFAPKVEGSGEPGGTLTLSWGSEMSWSTKVTAARVAARGAPLDGRPRVRSASGLSQRTLPPAAALSSFRAHGGAPPCSSTRPPQLTS
jgi:hypothetical protein